MSINIGPPEVDGPRPRITVIGVGGAGGNAIGNMMNADVAGVDFVIANTDAQALSASEAPQRIQLGPEITKGLGAGSRPEVGRAAAEETVDEIERLLDGVNMCFIAAGMGGGTGTGAAPVIAETARKLGVLTVGVVTKPFLFEGTRRMRSAEAGIEELQKHVDTLIVIPNQNLFLIAKSDTTFKEAFELADEVLQQGVRSITDLMVMPGLINLDFADIESVMKDAGKAMMGTGEGEGENRALEAAERAIANPLLEGVSMQGATGVIISIIGGEDMKLLELDEAANHIRELVDNDANIIWGSAFNPDLEGRIRVSVVATGIDAAAEGAADLAHRSGVGAPATNLSQSRGPARPTPRAVPAAADSDEPFARQPEPNARPGSAAFEGGDTFDRDAEEGAGAGGIVDPLAGLRNDQDGDEGDFETGEGQFAAPGRSLEENFSDEANTPASSGFSDRSETPHAAPASRKTVYGDDDDDWGDVGADFAQDNGEDDDTLDLGLINNENGGGRFAPPPAMESHDADDAEDELLLDASRLADADNDVQEPASQGRRRSLVSKDSADGSASQGAPGDGGKPAGGGSTLFERMASLSRGGAQPESRGADAGSDDEEDDDDQEPAVNIPRFLGRQNNQ